MSAGSKGMCTNVAGAYKVALKEDPESSYAQQANSGKTGKREMENLLEAYQLAMQSNNDDSIVMRGEPLLKILKEQEAPSATKLGNDYTETTNVSTKKRILARAAKTIEALLASDKGQEVAPYDVYSGLPTSPHSPISSTASGSVADPYAPLSPQGQVAPINSVELYVAPYNTSFGAQAGGRTLFISTGEGHGASVKAAPSGRSKQEVGTINHPE